jgi:AcrR family transcriptional regulator
MPSQTRSRTSAADDSRDPRERILLAAGREFAERGYEAATVRDICTAAGANVAAVNYYFGDKQRLYIESVKHAHEARLRQVPQPEWAPGTPAAQKLRDFVGSMLDRMLGGDQPPWQVRLMMRELLQPTEACRELVEDYIRPHFGILLGVLDELTGSALPGSEVRRLGLSIIGQCFLYRAAGDVVAMLVPGDEIDAYHTPQAIADHVTRLTLAAIGAAEPFARPGLGTVSALESPR